MLPVVATGIQNFADLREYNCFYIDKTDFIKEWWLNRDTVTAVMRPRRFGKTLTISMVECFFSSRYAGRSDLFEGLRIWDDEDFRALQGTWPVIALSFADVKEATYEKAMCVIKDGMTQAFQACAYDLYDEHVLPEKMNAFFDEDETISDMDAALSVRQLSRYMSRRYGKRVIILIDEYDTPLQEAWLNGYWDEMVSFFRAFMNATLKTNPALERGLLTGITRMNKESIFSDLNHLELVTTTSDKYAKAFGFTEQEVFAALDKYGLGDEGRKAEVKEWYDGFTFGTQHDMYNPWSIINYLGKKRAAPYWANTSSNGLVSRLIQRGSKNRKLDFEELLQGRTITVNLDEQIVFSTLAQNESACWSLLLAAGYLKAVSLEKGRYTLAITNQEVRMMFDALISQWFDATVNADHGDFLEALMAGDVNEMNRYMNAVAVELFSCFDVGTQPSSKTPERFYHGFVLGLIVDLRGRYAVMSNRESGFGRYDIMLEPLDREHDDGIIIEFKVIDADKGEKTLQDTLQAALTQIEEQRYAQTLILRGVPADRIRTYGIVFKGKKVLVG